jgi:hypothetical protein
VATNESAQCRLEGNVGEVLLPCRAQVAAHDHLGAERLAERHDRGLDRSLAHCRRDQKVVTNLDHHGGVRRLGKQHQPC